MVLQPTDINIRRLHMYVYISLASSDLEPTLSCYTLTDREMMFSPQLTFTYQFSKQRKLTDQNTNICLTSKLTAMLSPMIQIKKQPNFKTSFQRTNPFHICTYANFPLRKCIGGTTAWLSYDQIKFMVLL